MEELAVSLVSWIRGQVEAANRSGVVFGLSGGIDSAVVAVLCKRAFPDKLLGVIMPCHSVGVDSEHALLLTRKFQVPVRSVVLNGVFDSLIKAMPDIECDEATRRMAEANLKPRLRMATLYYLANNLGYLVVGTGNRSERSVGYFTKFGDGGVDIMPLGNLLKKDVKGLAVHLGVPGEIVDKAPSAGLWSGQTDEFEMQLTYDELDSYLETGEGRTEVRDRVERLSAIAAHKQCTPAIPPF
ncbi:NAD(+) synthase [Chloroflexota bacterium]